MQVASELSLKDEGKTVIKIEPSLGVAKAKVGRGVRICLSKG